MGQLPAIVRVSGQILTLQNCLALGAVNEL
jgi:hypothetical protein